MLLYALKHVIVKIKKNVEPMQGYKIEITKVKYEYVSGLMLSWSHKKFILYKSYG